MRYISTKVALKFVLRAFHIKPLQEAAELNARKSKGEGTAYKQSADLCCGSGSVSAHHTSVLFRLLRLLREGVGRSVINQRGEHAKR